jgi:hypothetical protein
MEALKRVSKGAGTQDGQASATKEKPLESGSPSQPARKSA